MSSFTILLYHLNNLSHLVPLILAFTPQYPKYLTDKQFYSIKDLHINCYAVLCF